MSEKKNLTKEEKRKAKTLKELESLGSPIDLSSNQKNLADAEDALNAGVNNDQRKKSQLAQLVPQTKSYNNRADILRNSYQKTSEKLESAKAEEKYIKTQDISNRKASKIEHKVEKYEKKLDKVARKQTGILNNVTQVVPTVSRKRKELNHITQINAHRRLQNSSQKKIDELQNILNNNIQSGNGDSFQSRRIRKQISKNKKDIQKRETKINQHKSKLNVIATHRQTEKRLLSPVATPINNIKRSVSNATTKAMQPLKTGIKRIGKATAKGIAMAAIKIKSLIVSALVAIFSPPHGPFVAAGLVLLFLLLGVTEPGLDYKYPEEDNSAQIEYQAWLNVFEETSDEFYEDYRVIIPGSYLAPIVYSYRDVYDYDKLLYDYEYNTELVDQEYYEAVVREYTKEMNPYLLRQLFLDEVDYQYFYLERTWTDWTEGITTEEEANTHDEDVKYKTTCTRTILVSYDVPDYNQCSQYRVGTNKYKTCMANPPTVQQYKWETEYYECDRWKVRDITSQKWIGDSNAENIDYYRETVNVGLPDVPEKDIDWVWHYYDENGLATKKVKYWKTRSFDDVVYDIAWSYHPQSTTYPGDVLILSAQELNDKVDIRIPKEQIYKEYYSGSPGIITENYFLDEYCAADESEMKMYAELFRYLYNGVDFMLAEGKPFISPLINVSSDASKAISQRFSSIDANSGKGIHGALDFGKNRLVASGTMYSTSAPIYVNAAADGLVVYAYGGARDNTSSNCTASSGGGPGCYWQDVGPDGLPGNKVIVEHKFIDIEGVERTLRTTYVHLKQGSVVVNAGDIVTAGQVIGEMGNSGYSTGTHLHFSVDEGPGTEDIDPEILTQFTVQ